MTLPMRALVVDDEKPARRWLASLLQTYPDIHIVGEADSVPLARQLLQQAEVDVVFLDVQMPPATGFDLLPGLEPGIRVVFVTAWDHFAVRAFEANALDYLLKPVRPQRLAETVARLRTAVASGRTGNLVRQPSVSENMQIPAQLLLDDLLPLKDRQLLRIVPVHQIAAIRAEGAYTRILISGQTAMTVLFAIGDWESRLPAPPFVRLDRSCLLNLDRMVESRTIDRNRTQVWLDGVDSPLILGRAASSRLRDCLRRRTRV